MQAGFALNNADAALAKVQFAAFRRFPELAFARSIASLRATGILGQVRRGEAKEPVPLPCCRISQLSQPTPVAGGDGRGKDGDDLEARVPPSILVPPSQCLYLCMAMIVRGI